MNNRVKLEILVGVSGSGKSTYAKKEFNKDVDNVLIVNRDSIRDLLFGYSDENIHEYYKRSDLNSLEKKVTAFEDTMIYEGIEMGKHIIVDATHLSVIYLKRFSYWSTPTYITIFYTEDIKTCFERDDKRTRKVGRDVISSQYKKFKKLINSEEFLNLKFDKEYLGNSVKNKHVIVFDIDGTLSEKGGRNPFNEKDVLQDEVHSSIVHMLQMYSHSGNEVIVCTGRTEGCRKGTEQWFRINVGFVPKMYMRSVGDIRPDWQVKTEMWNEICKDRYISLLVDDRNQVVRRARMLGLKVAQVEYGNF